MPPALVNALMAVAVLGVLAPVAASLLAAPEAEVPASNAQVAMPSAVEHRRARCEGCGIVEAIRTIDGIDGQPATYEFTVRLKDNSTRTSVTASAAQWRVGNRIIVMGGSGKP